LGEQKFPLINANKTSFLISKSLDETLVVVVLIDGKFSKYSLDISAESPVNEDFADVADEEEFQRRFDSLPPDFLIFARGILYVQVLKIKIHLFIDVFSRSTKLFISRST